MTTAVSGPRFVSFAKERSRLPGNVSHANDGNGFRDVAVGSHEADWSYNDASILVAKRIKAGPGLLPGNAMAVGAKGFNRMDEGRPINLGNGMSF